MNDKELKQSSIVIDWEDKKLPAVLFENDSTVYVIPAVQNKKLNPNLEGTASGEAYAPMFSPDDWAIRRAALENPASMDTPEKEELVKNINDGIDEYLLSKGIDKSINHRYYNKEFEEAVFAKIQEERKQKSLIQ